jgi:hypothetical protein
LYIAVFKNFIFFLILKYCHSGHGAGYPKVYGELLLFKKFCLLILLTGLVSKFLLELKIDLSIKKVHIARRS